MSTKKILILDDDSAHLRELAEFLRDAGYQPLLAANINEACAHLEEQPDFAIVDLFLDGDAGAHLSNGFISERLEPAGIAYARMTSAPSMVNKEFVGEWVFNKRIFWHDPSALLPYLRKSLDREPVA